jgi:hypothetical protein
MARNDDTARESEGKSLLDRRGYLRLAGSAAASVAAFGAGASAADDDLLLHLTYEDSSYRDVFTYQYDMYDEITTDRVKSGSSALKVPFPEGSHDGMTAEVDPVDAGLTDSPIEDIYATYWVYFPQDFVGNPQGMKLPGPVNYMEERSETDGNGTGHGGDPAVGYGWSARTGFNDTNSEEIQLGGIPYHMDDDGGYPMEKMGYRWVTKGEWHRITQHVKVNTTSGGSANYDGVYEMWIDDEKTIDRHDMRWTEHPEEGIDYRHTVWYGGNKTSPKDQAVYLDDMKIDRNPVGAAASGSSSGTTTTEPSNEDKSSQPGEVLEIVSGSNMATTDYEFVVEGTASKHTSAGDNAAEGNDSITDNGDGTVTVTGATGNGYGDAYYVDGAITSMSLGDGNWTLRYGGSEVSKQDLVYPNKLVIDGSNAPRRASTYQFSVSGSVRKSASLGSINERDSVSNGEIEGRVIGGRDGYRFSGEVTGFTLDGPANIRVEDQG